MTPGMRDMFAATPLSEPLANPTPVSNPQSKTKSVKSAENTPKARVSKKNLPLHPAHLLEPKDKVYVKLKGSKEWGFYKVVDKRKLQRPWEAKTQQVTVKNMLVPTQILQLDLKSGGHDWTQDESEFEKRQQEPVQEAALVTRTDSELENLEALTLLPDEVLAEIEASGTTSGGGTSRTLLTSNSSSDPASFNCYYVSAGETHFVFATSVPRSEWHLPHVVAAKNKEMDNLRKFKTFEEVEEDMLTEVQNDNKIRSLWVVVNKDLMGESVTKARLCCMGCDETAEVETTSPTATRISVRMLLTIAATKDWKVSSLDFSGAFLQGKAPEREVIVIPPKDQQRYTKRGVRILWRLLKRLYGLRDASRGFWLEVDSFLLELGCQRAKYDKATYLLFDKQGNLLGLCAVHVDDLLYAGTEEFHERIIRSIIDKFVIGRVESQLFTFTGWTLQQQAGRISLTQDPYVEKLAARDLEVLNLAGKDGTLLLPEAGQQAYRSAVGALAWLTGVTRPDLAREQTELAARQGKATVRDANRAYKVIKKVASVPQTIAFHGLGDLKGCRLKVFVDAAQGRKESVESIKGSIYFLQDPATGLSNPLDWNSSAIRPPAISSLAAEAAALNDAYGRTEQLRDIVASMCGLPDPKQVPADISIDCRSLYDAIDSDSVPKDRRSAVAIATLRDIKEKEENLKFMWVPGRHNIADHMTKSGTNTQSLLNILSGREMLPSNESAD